MSLTSFDDVMCSVQPESAIRDYIAMNPSKFPVLLLPLGTEIETERDLKGTMEVLDILSIDEAGRLWVTELKLNGIDRNAVAQIVSYASWADQLSMQELKKRFPGLGKKFLKRFRRKLPEKIIHPPGMILAGRFFPEAIKRLFIFLRGNFKLNILPVEHEQTRRSWKFRLMTDMVPVPEEEQTGQPAVEFFFSQNECGATWDDCRENGFLPLPQKWPAGGKRLLLPNTEVFVHYQETGCVGRGVVESSTGDFSNLKARCSRDTVELWEKLEIKPSVIRIRWKKTFPRNQAFSFLKFSSDNPLVPVKNQERLITLKQTFQ
jgi:hypothetical protein